MASLSLPWLPFAFPQGKSFFGEAKIEEMKPKGNQKELKGSQMKAKGRQRRARKRQREAKGGKGRP